MATGRTKQNQITVIGWKTMFNRTAVNCLARFQLHRKRRKVCLRTGSKTNAEYKARKLDAAVIKSGWADGLAGIFDEAVKVRSNVTLAARSQKKTGHRLQSGPVVKMKE